MSEKLKARLIVLTVSNFLVAQMAFSQSTSISSGGSQDGGHGSGGIEKFTNVRLKPFWTMQSGARSYWLRGVCFTDASHGTAVGDYGTILHTTDGGMTWQHLTSGTSNHFWGVTFCDEHFGVIVGENGAMFRTTNGGDTWQSSPSGTNNYLLGVTFAGASVGLAVGGYGTILRTTDCGLNWMSVPSGTVRTLMGVSLADQMNGVAVGDEGVILKTTDGGLTWSPRVSGTTNFIRDVQMIDALNGIAVSYGSLIFRTTDGGEIWQMRNSGTPGNLNGVSFANDNVGVIVGDVGVILRTTDGGGNWVREPSGMLSHLFGIFLNSADTGTAVGIETIFRRVVVEGASMRVNENWNMVSVPLSVPDYLKTVVFPSATSDAFGYEGDYNIKDTLKQGHGYWLRFPATYDVVIGGTDVTVMSIAVVEGWNMIGSISSPVAVTSVESNPAGITTSNFFGFTNTYIIADSIMPGKAYWVKVTQVGTLSLVASGSSNATSRIRIVPTSEMPPAPPSGDQAGKPKALPSVFALRQSYPNPFNPLTVIEFDLPKAASVTLKIYDLVGREILTLKNNDQYEAGTYKVQFDASNFASGVYFYRIEAQSDGKTFVDVKKMMLLR